MNTPSYQVNEITSKFIQSSFPKLIIPKELTIYHDLIFTNYSQLPKVEHKFNDQDKDKKIKYFQHLIFDEKYKKVSINSHKEGQKSGWKKDEEENQDNNNFFDNFKGKFNNSDVNSFKRNQEITSQNCANLLFCNNRFIDFKEQPHHLSQFNQTSIDDFFNNFDETIKKGNYMKLPLIECVYKVNERINYPRNQPLWYVYHAEADSSYGPLSSEDIEQMINSKLLDFESKVRLIDVFVYKGSKQFEFFTMKELTLDNFPDNIKVSNFAFNFKQKPNCKLINLDIKGSQPQTTIYSSNSTSLYETVTGGNQSITSESKDFNKQKDYQQGGSYTYNNPHSVKNTNYDSEDQKQSYNKNYYQKPSNYYQNQNYNDYYGKIFT